MNNKGANKNNKKEKPGRNNISELVLKMKKCCSNNSGTVNRNSTYIVQNPVHSLQDNIKVEMKK